MSHRTPRRRVARLIMTITALSGAVALPPLVSAASTDTGPTTRATLRGDYAEAVRVAVRGQRRVVRPRPTTTTSTTTVPPTTVPPTTVPPTTVPPTTVPPTTAPPTTAPPTTAPPVGGVLRPFNADSPWNIGVGTGATLRGLTDPMTTNIRSTTWTPWVNAGQYSHPVIQAKDSDPVVSMTCRFIAGVGLNATIQFKMPLDATAAPGMDGHLHVVDPSRREVFEMFQVRGSGTSRTCDYLVRNDLASSGFGNGGTRAHGGSAIGGLILGAELRGGQIDHALAIALAAGQLRLGWVWPATTQDGNAASSYYGQVPMGSYVVIPSNVDVGSLGLSAAGRTVATALQRYGGYVVDRASGFMLYAEPSMEGSAELSALRRDMSKIVAQVRVVSNNGPTSVNGGGSYPWRR
jgi:hypothetical protein